MTAVHVTVWDDCDGGGGGRVPTASQAPAGPAAVAALIAAARRPDPALIQPAAVNPALREFWG